MESLFNLYDEAAEAPAPLFPACGKCGLDKGCTSPKMKPAGKGRKDILVVGEFPGLAEDSEGVPVAGSSARRLRHALQRGGVDLFEDCRVMNAVNCRSPKPSKNLRSIDHCRPLTLNEIKASKPKVIILVGTAAVRSVIGHVWPDDLGPVTRWEGRMIPLRRWDCWACPVRGFFDLAREADEMADREFEESVYRACQIDHRPVFGDDASKIIPELSDDEAVSVLKRMRKSGRPLAFDYETTCLKPQGPDARIVCCSVSDGFKSVAYPWAGRAANMTRKILFDPAIPKVGWNCFSGNVRFLTKEHGVVSLASVTGKTVTVLNHEGRWVPATIKEFGKAETQELTFVRRNVSITVPATGNHRWLTNNEEYWRTSDELKNKRWDGLRQVADTVPFSLIPRPVPNLWDWEEGVRHGIIYGDGTKRKDRKGFYQLRLCGEKKELLQFFQNSKVSYPPSYENDPMVYYTRQSEGLKELPPPEVNDSYRVGFFQGIMATDGCVARNGQISLSGNRPLVDWCLNQLPRIGYWCQGVTDMRKYGPSKFGTEDGDYWTIYLNRETVLPRDLLRSRHQKNYKPTDLGPWKFSKRGKTKLEPVYCAVVPSGGTFTLEGGIVTGNCKFEDLWSRFRAGGPVRGWAWDGMLAAHAIDPRPRTSGLKFQAFVNLGIEDYSSSITPYLRGGAKGGNAPNKVAEAPLKKMLEYCAFDSLYEWRVSKIQAARLGSGLFDGL